MKRMTGFSLLEVLAALLLLAFLLLGVYSGIRTVSHTVRSGSAAVERLDQVRSTQQLLRRELAQAMTQPIKRNDNGESIYFVGKPREMRYVAPLPGYLGKLGPQLQTLQLVDNGKTGMRLEMRLAVLPPDGSPSRPLGEPQVLLDHVHAGSFSYRGSDDQGRVGDWQTDWPDGRRMPALVRIDVQLDGLTPWPRLQVPLRVDSSALQPLSGLLQGVRSPAVNR